MKRRVPSETSHEKNQPSVIAMLLAAKSHEVPYRCIWEQGDGETPRNIKWEVRSHHQNLRGECLKEL